MKLARYLCVLGLWLAIAPGALADDLTPEATSPPPAATEPTSPPAVDSAPLPTAAPPAVDSAPVDISREHGSGSAGSAGEAAPPPADTVPTQPAVPNNVETGPTLPPLPVNPATAPRAQSTEAAAGSSSAPASPGTSSAGSTYNPADLSGTSPSLDLGAVAAPYVSGPAPAPTQLTCHGRKYGDALPFLVSPYDGWTEVASFLDHDSPDYTVDGSIVLANGTTASASDGQESDVFPAYWSPALRQYVNYDGHNGYDFDISYQPVLAAAAGTVTFAGWNSSDQYAGYGQMILIDHHNGYVTLYGHLSELDVKQGDKVQAGQQIGISGTTGNSTGPHLHFSVFHNCAVTDPYGWTGHGTDPLDGFDHERATYLWLPGHDPLVLNPPPNWPAFPLGLRLPDSAVAGVSRLLPHGSSARLPPVDRLLLLNLPESQSVGTSSAAVALARTEAAITQEAEGLTPTLDDLENQGLIEKYQVIPAAAAVWLRGTASSAQLLSLPGVASLAGVKPRDLGAAQAGLAHDVLTQIGQQQAPALWPVGFRSTQNTWRPVMTVVNGHALVSGVALPGRRVSFSLRRRGQIVGVAETTTDAQTGGFVAMIHDVQGNPVTTQAGDVVQVQSAGKRASITLVPLIVQARSESVFGRVPAGVSMPIVTTHVGGNVAGQTIVTVGSAGTFHVPGNALYSARTLPAGEIAVGSITDTAGDQEAASGCVPGIEVTVNSATVRGWTVGHTPTLALVRHGRFLLRRRLHPAPDGTFQIELHLHHQPLPVRAGDILRIGSPWHHHNVPVPSLGVSLRAGTHSVAIVGPRGSRVYLSVLRSTGHTVSETVVTPESGRKTATIAGPAVTLGDVATTRYVLTSGDTIAASSEARGLLLREGSATVSGVVHPGIALSVHALSSSGARLGGAVASADDTTGRFSAEIQTRLGRPLPLQPSMQLLIREPSGTTLVTLPQLGVARSGKQVLVSARVSRGSEVTWTALQAGGKLETRRLLPSKAGTIAARFALDDHGVSLRRVTIAAPLGEGISVERMLSLAPPSTHRSAARTAVTLGRCTATSTPGVKGTSHASTGCRTPAQGH